MRVAAIDIGTNSTRLLIADVEPDGTVTELDRRSIVTRLGQGVDVSGTLSDEAMERVFAALVPYRQAADEQGVEVTTGVLTSAVRDASNGAAFQAQVRERFGFAVDTITGDREAQLTFRGATSDHLDDDRDGLPAMGGGQRLHRLRRQSVLHPIDVIVTARRPGHQAAVGRRPESAAIHDHIMNAIGIGPVLNAIGDKVQAISWCLRLLRQRGQRWDGCRGRRRKKCSRSHDPSRRGRGRRWLLDPICVTSCAAQSDREQTSSE